MTSISTRMPAVSGSAVLDSAHAGDIVGAFGRIGRDDTGPIGGRRRRLRTLMVISGPGLIVMVGDNDAGGVATYAQAGQNYGMNLLWTLTLLIPVLSPDGQWLAGPLIDGATTNLWALPTSGGDWKQITDFGDRSTVIARSVSWSPDSGHIYAAIADTETDIVLLNGLL